MNYHIAIGRYGTMHVTPDTDHGIIIQSFTIDTQDAPPMQLPSITEAACWITPPRPFRIARPVDESPAIPSCFMDDDLMPMKEHQAIMIPSNGKEGMFAIAEHLGEGQRTVDLFVDTPGIQFNMSRGQLLLPLEGGLTQLERMIYDEAVVTAQGEPCLPHTVRSTRAWFSHAGGIKKKFACTVEEAETLELAFRILDTTPKMAATFAKWLTPEKFATGYIYFQDLAKQMVLVTDEGEPRIMTTTITDEPDDDQEINADNPAEIVEIQAEGYHKLDDPRDDEKLWEDKQPAPFRKLLAQIRGTKKLADLKIIGKSLFNDKRFNKTQASVLWDVYRNRKFALEPKLRPVATRILSRLTEPDASLAKAAYWLNGEGKTVLTQHEQSVIWAAWKKVRISKIPDTKKQQADLDLSTMPDEKDYAVSEYIAETYE